MAEEKPREFWPAAPEALRRGLGAPALFGIGQGFVAASIYFSLGLVSGKASGLTWLVYAGALIFFALLVLSYVEGVSLHTERGGVTVTARYAFNELVSFIAGWAVSLDYLIVIAITALAATGYAAVFWAPLGGDIEQVVLAVAIIIYVSIAHLRGPGPRRYERAAFLVLADLAVQLIVVIFGFIFLFNPDVLLHPAMSGKSPSLEEILFAFTIAIAAFGGLDASSGLAGQVRIGRRGLRRLISARLLAAAVPYIGIALIATSVLPLPTATADAPVVGVVDSFTQEWLREPLRYIVAASAIVIFIVACNAAMLGLSRLGYSLAVNRQIPSLLGHLHSRYSTPYVVIGVGGLLAAILVLPSDLEFLLAIYAFGATLSFLILHLSVCALRAREPNRDRPYKMPLNIRIKGVEWPIFAVIGVLVSAIAFLSVVSFHTGARFVGLGWMIGGLVLYLVYRTTEDKPLLGRISVPEAALRTADEHEAEYTNILVPILGTELDDDIVQTAGRLARAGRDEERAAKIEALGVVVVPLALALDAPLPPEQLEGVEKRLIRARAIGEEYEGVRVSTKLVRSRDAGEAIVAEARAQNVEAIIMAVEEPTQLKGGALFGGKEALREMFVGETTRHVVNKAPCRVILTAPP